MPPPRLYTGWLSSRGGTAIGHWRESLAPELFDNRIGEKTMTDTSSVATAARAKESVADRQWIDEANTEVEDPALATGCRYVDKASGRAFVYQTKLPAGSHATMLAVFGALTKAGNIRSTLVNGPKGDANADVIQGIDDWFTELVDNGVWAADRVGGGIRVNPEALARAIAHVKGEHHPDAHLPYLARITNKDKVLDKGDKSGNKEILYSTFAMRNKQVEQKYNEFLPQHAAAPAVSDL